MTDSARPAGPSATYGRDSLLRRAGAGLALLLCVAVPAFAHDVELTKVTAYFSNGGRFQVDIYYDVNAWLLGVRPEHLTPQEMARLTTMPAADSSKRIDELRDHILRTIRLRFDEANVVPVVEFIDNPEPTATQPLHGSPMLRIIRLSGPIPPGAKNFDFWSSKTYGNIALIIRHESRDEVTQQLLERAERSRPYTLAAATQEAGAWQVARQYLRLGYEHILPKGLDHILFVLALFLLSNKLGPLLWQVTAFTLAHTVSLALSMYGVISLSPRIVEPLIALSIAAVAVENLVTSRLHPWRPVVVFLFGLLHGLGFAGALTELGLPRGQFATALISFNVGVELGQVSVILLAFAAVGWFRSHAWYRPRIVIPASLLISATGLYWTIARVML